MEHLIIDAYNLLHQRQKKPPQKHPWVPRDLVYSLEHYAVSRDKRVTLVFDGTRYQGDLDSSDRLRVLFSSPGDSADVIIERLMLAIAPRDRLSARLVSDDGALRRMAIGAGLRVTGCGAFWNEMEAFLDSLERTPSSEKPKEPFNNPFYYRF